LPVIAAKGVQQIAGGSRQPVEPRHGQHVAGVEHVEQPEKLRPVGLCAARHFVEHLARPVLPECADLSGDALAVRRYPRIAVNHRFICTKIPHQESLITSMV
jgi:hypothetical protein